MATCPRCFGTLTENHKCPRGLTSRVTHALSTFAAGAILGALACYVFDDRPAPALLLAGAALGAVLAGALRQAIEGPAR
jgi:hypothetical protein